MTRVDGSKGRFHGDLPERTLNFAIRIVDLVDLLPEGTKGWVIGKQLLRSGTSIGANVHEADDAFSDEDFVYRCSVSRKEASETRFWLRICQMRNLLDADMVNAALTEVDELSRILATIARKSRQ
jgi:four helix bundle protein